MSSGKKKRSLVKKNEKVRSIKVESRAAKKEKGKKGEQEESDLTAFRCENKLENKKKGMDVKHVEQRRNARCSRSNVTCATL